MEALLNKVIVEEIIATTLLDRTEGKASKTGTVISVGPTNVSGVAVGDTVLFGAYAGVPFDIGGKEYLLVQESEIGVKL